MSLSSFETYSKQEVINENLERLFNYIDLTGYEYVSDDVYEDIEEALFRTIPSMGEFISTQTFHGIKKPS